MAKAEEELKLGLASKVALEAVFPWLPLVWGQYQELLPTLNAYAAVLRRIDRAQAVLEEKK